MNKPTYTTHTETKVLSCPFCGHPANIIIDTDDNNGCCRIGCTNSEGCSVFPRVIRAKADLEDAVRIWNWRVPLEEEKPKKFAGEGGE